MDRKKLLKGIILTAVMVVLIVGYYCYLSSRNEKLNSAQNAEKQAEEMTAVEELLARSEFKEYPTTPVQVVKYYNEITACFYNEQYTEEQLQRLAELTRTLFDKELVANQTFEDYLEALKNDIEVFKAGNIRIYSSEVTPSTDVFYFEHDGYQCARLNSVYSLKSGTNYQTSKEIYILRKDEANHWKIMGFKLDKGEDS